LALDGRKHTLSVITGRSVDRSVCPYASRSRGMSMGGF